MPGNEGDPTGKDDEFAARGFNNSGAGMLGRNISGPILKKVYMKNSDTHNQRIAKMTFASVYPMYLEKVEKKGRTKEELHQVIGWLTSFDNEKLEELIQENATFETFFQQASLNPNAHLITGVICGYRVEEIKDPLTQQVRYLDKLVDELAKGKKMEKVLRGTSGKGPE